MTSVQKDLENYINETKPIPYTFHLRSSFQEMFMTKELDEYEKKKIEDILILNMTDQEEVHEDLQKLLRLTSEIRGIHNQSILLQGERIKIAQEILKSYKKGAFEEWLVTTYQNKRTPYHMLSYFNFYNSMPEQVRPKIENVPKKAVYVLAARSGQLEKKQEIIETYNGETQEEVIARIKDLFETKQKRKKGSKNNSVNRLIINIIQNKCYRLMERWDLVTDKEKKRIKKVLEKIINKI